MELILITNPFLTAAISFQGKLECAHSPPPKYVLQYAYVLGDLSENDSGQQ